MKKVIIATDFWHQASGVAKATEEISQYLVKNGFTVTVVHPKLFFNLPNIFYSEYRVAFFLRRKIKKIIEREKPDHIHIVSEGPIGFAVRTICSRKKIPFTTAYHGNVPDYIEHYINIKSNAIIAVTYAYLRWFHNGAVSTMVSTKSLQEKLEHHGFRHLVICPLGVDVELFKKNNDLRVRQQNIFTHPVFVYFGRLAKEKSVEEFLQCHLEGTKLVIGSGPIGKQLQKNYPDAIFTGQKTKKELVDLLSICDVFVFPSRTETFGLVVLEALSCQIPVAAHNVMGPRDIITNGVDGFLGENLQEAAIKCLQLSRENCRRKALTFSWEKSGQTFINNLAAIR